ncbi:protein kinase domain-containing protein [Halorussus amylolyticus]|uniref:protein kinase domain-containing protein n=1 Tax=Halorussus amylolyticus TaxID=1126242 RepID=UPI00104A6ACC|nr:HEAT repeat domain-containing protein [Halorussus amylolyticus]
MAESGADEERLRRLREMARERWGDDDTADVDELVAMLDSPDADERAEASWALAERASDADRSWRLPVETKLASLLEDDDRWVRRGASWALATVAEDRPQRGRSAVGNVTAGLTDDDPLVRENNVIALASVASEYPHAAEPALSRLADLARDGDGLVQRYAAETLRSLVVALDESGFPETVETTSDVADLLPGDAGVVTVTDDEDAPAVRVGDDSSESDDADETDGGLSTARPLEIEGGDAPPARIPSPPDVRASFREFDRLAELGSDPVTTAEKVRAPTARGDHVVVALRTLRPEANVAPETVETALRAWAGVSDHDHVAPVLARGNVPRPWLATEFMDGGTLASAGGFEFERALWCLHCVTKAVCHAHSRGVVHGALRPGVVGLSQTLDGWAVPKVRDWGFSDVLAEAASLPTPPGFAAPEHVAPERFGPPDHATDVYQLGALSYAVFAGRPPFVGDSREVARSVRDDDPAPVTAFASVPDAVADLLDRALTKSKPARFETAEDFQRELEVLVAEYGRDDW